MAIIYICDICKKEMENQTKISIYKFTEAMMDQEGIKYIPKEEIYCNDCSDKIKEEIKKLKK